jgi:NTE family protein
MVSVHSRLDSKSASGSFRSVSKIFASLALCMAFLLPANCSARADDSSNYLVETSQGLFLDVEKRKKEGSIANSTSGRPKIGLALGGGGARGAAHVGVLEVLEKEGIKFDYITGTSIGSVVGGLYAAGVPLTTIHRDFENGQIMRHFMTVSLPVRIALAPVLYIPRILGAKPYDGLYNGKKFRNYMERTLPADQRLIQNLKIPFAAVSLNIVDGKPYMIRGGDLGDAMQASTAVPGLRKPVEIGGKLFVDGGVACNLPVKQCRQLGADIVIAVNIDEPFRAEALEVFRKPGSVTKRMIKWDLYDIDAPQEGLADVVIHPNTEGVTLVTRSTRKAKETLEQGRKAAEAALPQIRKVLQEAGVTAMSTAEK